PGDISPLINPFWISFEFSSKDLSLVSGSRKVNRNPIKQTAAKNSSRRSTNLLVPPVSLSAKNPTCDKTAPNFPQAADIPWHVQR
ncbi:6308_t:CDS:1, partial [Scutellospora calospora]